MKTAILLTGNVRTWDQTKQSFIDTFGPMDPAVFLATYNKRYNYHPYIQGKFGFTDDDHVETQEILDLFSGVNLRGLYVDENSSNYTVPDDVHHKFKDLESTYYQYIKLAQAVEMMKNQEEASGRYDVVIRTRCDLVYTGIDISSLTENEKSIIVDSGNMFPNDVLIASSRDNMVRLTEFIVNEFYNPVDPDSHLTPPHGLVHAGMKHLGLDIKSQKIIDHVLRRNDQKHYY